MNLGKYSQIIKSSHGSLSKPCHSLPTFIFISGRTWSERGGRFLASLHLVDSERVLSETRTTVFNRPPTREESPSTDLCQIQILRSRSLQIQIQRGFLAKKDEATILNENFLTSSFKGLTKCSTVNHLVNCVTICACRKKFNLAQHYEKWTSNALQGNEVGH